MSFLHSNHCGRLASAGPPGQAHDQARKRVVFVGDSDAGKTSLLIVFLRGEFPAVYVPKTLDPTKADFHLPDDRTSPISLDLIDTVGHAQGDRMRPLAYDGCDVCVVCFSVAARESLESIETKWIVEARRYCPDAPVVVVACKADLRRSTAETGAGGIGGTAAACLLR
ncbi:P-loop containing nucleoside triphosphate hydrolase protein [Zopfochytrium polystomum]|nr:P-loop containing nucleoside triphosphate hydrolase protein [Zopfochytrium polystomum]